MVEWAIVFPILMILLMGTCQWAILQLQANALQQAAFSAARARMVRENPYDAAAISMMPFAGWSDTLRGNMTGSGGSQEVVLQSDPLNAKTIPGWSTQPRSHLLPERLSVSIVEEDWEKVTMEANFKAELYFPMVETFFRQVCDSSIQIGRHSVTADGPMIGFSRTLSSDATIEAVNFVELRARASIPRCDHPQGDDFIGTQNPSHQDNLYPESRDGLQTVGPDLYVVPSAQWVVRP